MAVTLKRIAEHCGLSPQTVGYILNGKADLFRPETRDKVLAAARELGYRPNAAAKAMRSGRFGCAALVLSTQPGRSSLFPAFLAGVDDELAKTGMHLAHAPLADERLSDTGFVPKILSQVMADGLLINYNAEIPPALIEAIERHRIPAVWINSQQPHNCVFPDDLGAGRQATEHLLSLGHRRIAYVDYSYGSARPAAHYSSRDRQGGYEQAMHGAGLTPRVIRSPEGLSSGQRLPAILAWLKAADRPSAVVTYSPRDALPILHAATAILRLRVPQDLSLATIEDDVADQSGVALTTVIIPRYDLGSVAVQMLLERIADPQRELTPRALACRLVVGESSGASGGDL